ncbi:hypothetical protein LuPra_03366 [Luteitalea pratensis]|uniref:Uncharacterized protein n=1 Tax=Luteitalea pratensis TaxID=1855912 RepID=A0A143PPT9_LUTPR|nr:hypothetical protein [Luteitalea pratensis]AMY10138.1 hypothetical protein LuPra_03366 [Luteitalea pratensis]
MATHLRGLADAALKDGRALALIAYHAGLDETTVWTYALCQRRGPSRRAAEALAATLDVDVDSLIAPGPAVRSYGAFTPAERAALQYGKGNIPPEALKSTTTRR